MMIGTSGVAGGQVTITLTSSGRIKIFNGTTFIGQTAAGVVSLNTWHFIAVTVDGTAGGLKIYSDGIEVTGSHTATFNVTNSTIHVGAFGTPGTFYADGNLANVFYCTEILTQDQVRQIMRFSSSAQFATIAGMESFYPLSADFNDAIGSANLTNNGATLQIKKPQLPRGLDLARGAAQARVYTGRAIGLDGSADYLATETSAALGDTFTITAWIKRNSAATLDYVVNVGNPSGAGNAISISIGNTNPGLLYFFDNGTSVYTTNKVEYNTWYHVALTVAPGAGTAKLYMNGIDGTPAHSVNINITDTTFEIGRYLGGSHWFYGWISDVRVFNSTLTADQVKELYHYPEQVLPTGVSASNLIHRWALSDYNDTGATGGRYFQDSAGSNAMEDKASASMEFAQPVPCPQLGLQQSATRVYFENNATRADATLGAAPGTACTMSAWLMVENTGNFQYIFNQGTTFTANAWFGIAKWNTDNRLYTLQSSTLAAESSLQLSGDGEWNHVVVMTKSTAPYVRFFINGVEDTSIIDRGMVAYNLTSTSVTLGSNPAYNNNLQGFMNDCAIWDVELSDPEVAALYNSGVMGMDVSTVQSSNLKGWWKCDDLTTFKDYSGNGANATLTGSVNAASFPENASGSTIVGDFSMKRKGVSVLNAPGSGRATLAANASLLPTTGGGYTLCAFVRLQSTDDDAAVIMSTSTGTNEWGTFYEGSTNKYKIVLSDGTTNILDRAFSGTVTDSEWHHIAWTIQLDAVTANGETYIDGAPDLSFTRSSFNTPPTPSEFAIGYDPGNADKQANAAIACLRIYQSVLSANEIKQVYSSDLRLIKGLNNE
jgi:hypothetical protein